MPTLSKYEQMTLHERDALVTLLREYNDTQVKARSRLSKPTIAKLRDPAYRLTKALVQEADLLMEEGTEEQKRMVQNTTDPTYIHRPSGTYGGRRATEPTNEQVAEIQSLAARGEKPTPIYKRLKQKGQPVALNKVKQIVWDYLVAQQNGDEDAASYLYYGNSHYLSGTHFLNTPGLVHIYFGAPTTLGVREAFAGTLMTHNTLDYHRRKSDLLDPQPDAPRTKYVQLITGSISDVWLLHRQAFMLKKDLTEPKNYQDLIHQYLAVQGRADQSLKDRGLRAVIPRLLLGVLKTGHPVGVEVALQHLKVLWRLIRDEQFAPTKTMREILDAHGWHHHTEGREAMLECLFRCLERTGIIQAEDYHLDQWKLTTHGELCELDVDSWRVDLTDFHEKFFGRSPAAHPIHPMNKV